ncbi:MAG: MMPL family transporter [Candidatus Cohnella colombiensis]|uniref:MMPL family transporter n=1 Tax=Candidatus Cohnella colombiensis TaxID=3121368 RepID=A0AA95F6J6_9BACL|nr:MAG: MMPL family transporter [Cohnella sp.]
MTDGSYSQVQQILSQQFHMPEEPIILLFENDKEMPRRTFHSLIKRTLTQIERIGGVHVSSSPLEQKEMEKGNIAYALLSVPNSIQEKRQAIKQIREAISVDRKISIKLTGKPVIQEDVNRLSKYDLKRAERIGIPIAFIILVMTLGGLLSAIIPIVAGAMTVVIAMGIMDVIGDYGGVSLSVFVYSVIPMVGMAVCIDFALLMISRFKEENRHLPANEALLITMATSGRAIVISVGCVIMALLGTLYIRMPIFNTVTLGTLVVLTVSLMINLIFVPALLYRLRKQLYSSRKDKFKQKGRSLWMAFIYFIMRWPQASAILAIIILSVSLYPVLTMQIGIPGPESLPKNNEARIASEKLAKWFESPFVSNVWIIAKDKNQEIQQDILRTLEQDSRVIHVDAVRSYVNKETTFINVWLQGNESSREVREWILERSNQFAMLGVQIGGEPKYKQEIVDEVFYRLKYVLFIVICSNWIILTIAFRSLLIPLKAIVMNLVSIFASFGILTWIFQEGKLGMETSNIAIMIPIFIFGLTFGISMDYGIFLLSRIYEGYKNSLDNEHSIREGLAVSGKIITSAAAIMIAVTAPFALAEVSGVRQLGIGIAIAIFLDATIVRMVLVPALMKWFGKWNWWSPFNKKL